MSFLKSIFGGGSSAPQINYNPSGIVNPTGFSVSPGGAVSDSSALSSNIGSLQSTFGAQAGALGGLAATVGPGFSQGRQAGLADIANTFMAQRSNLKDSLAQRRILGSSFANSQFSQLAATQAQTQADFEAKSYLDELQAQYQLIQAQYTAQTNQYSTAINQSNIESQTAASLTASNNNIAAQIATANANLQAQAQAGAGSFLGTLIGTGASMLNAKTLAGGLSGGGLGGSAAPTIFGDIGAAGDAAALGGDATTIASSGADVLPMSGV